MTDFPNAIVERLRCPTMADSGAIGLGLAIEAADAIDRLSSDAEKLREALRELLDANEQHHNAPPDWDRLDAALLRAHAVLGVSESVSSPESPR